VDLAAPDGPGQLIQRAVADHGRIDVLVNNVGAVRMRLEGFLATSDEDFAAPGASLSSPPTPGQKDVGGTHQGRARAGVRRRRHRDGEHRRAAAAVVWTGQHNGGNPKLPLRIVG
jgi:hypothetical protein